ncbi:MAG TPA: ferritin-like domain-containing protein [Mucilaginibacter sp.]|jgi:hypothetical protein
MKTETQERADINNMERRSFLRYAGVGVASVGLLATAACHKGQKIGPHATDIGSGDFGILNYAYTLEQLEVAFYSQVVLTPYSGMSSMELSYLTSIRDHEILHRNFLKDTLGTNGIIDLVSDFSSINFSSRASVLGRAKTFEDLGVMAYDGAAYLLKDPNYLSLLGKIVSVEARHAALIRNLITPGSFAGSDVVASNGLNNSLAIAQVLPMVNTFLKTKVNAANYSYYVAY